MALLSGATAAALAGGAPTAAAPAPTMPTRRVDVHTHFLPDYYREALVAAGQTKPDGMPKIPDWSEAEALTAMDRLGIATAMVSVSSPGVHFGDDGAARRLARRVNETAAGLARGRPDRFGFFAITPLPDVEGAIAEACYALDELGADGVVLETNHHGVYLGDAKLDGLYAELNRRRAVVFIHPTSPDCPCCETLALGYPRPLMEFIFETTRSVVQMILSGATTRYPDLRVIVPHAGAALPVIASRIEAQIALVPKAEGQTLPDLRTELRRLHYDLAGAPLPEGLGALLQIADRQHLHYGSDWPFTPTDLCEQLVRRLDATPLLDAETLRAAMGGNARRLLFPRLAQG